MIDIKYVMVCYDSQERGRIDGSKPLKPKAFDIRKPDGLPSPSEFLFDFGGSYATWQENLTDKQRWQMLFEEMLVAIIDDNCDAKALHNELKTKLKGYAEKYEKFCAYTRFDFGK